MTLFKQKPERKLAGILLLIVACYLAVTLFMPRVMFRSSRMIQGLYWRIACIGQQTEHIKNAPLPLSPKKGTILIMLDDGWMTQYTQGRTIMERYGIKGSVAVISSAVGEHNYMSIRELSALYKSGWDMANHTDSHPWLNSLSQEKQKKEMVAGRKWLKRYFMTGAENDIIFPGGYFDAATFKAMEQAGFSSARSIENYWSIQPTTRMNSVSVASITPHYKIQDIQDIIESVAEQKSVLILMFHKFDETPDAWGMTYSPKDFEAICKMIAENENLQTGTISQLPQLLSEQLRQS